MAEDVPPAEGKAPNILVIVLDAVRAKSVKAGGGRRVAKTPVLDALAARGAVFSRAVAPANWTVPSHMSMMTGSYPAQHGVRTFMRGDPPSETIGSWLHRQSYQTGIFTEQAHLVAGYGLESGYDMRFSRRMGMANEERTSVYRLFGHNNVLYSKEVRRVVEAIPPLIIPLNAINHPNEVAFKKDRCGSYVIDEFQKWVSTLDAGRPFHAFINMVDGHEPYPSTEKGRSMSFFPRWYGRTPRYYILAVSGMLGRLPWDELEGGYLIAIEQVDRKLGAILDVLAAAGRLDNTYVIVTADHGQSFGEGGNVFHGCGATDSITRVPLVVAPPVGITLPARVEPWVTLCDLPAWMKAMASGKTPFDDGGKPPFPFAPSAHNGGPVYCEGGPASDPNRSLKGIRMDQSWNHRLIAAYDGTEKWILDTETGTIDHWADAADPDHEPAERLTGDAAKAVREKVYGAYEAFDAQRIALKSGTKAVEVTLDERLRSWGYD
ncbi:MAG: sulfatase [Thermoplasmata archaeon]|nr:sulfatase [Thermoplasmata archaeon]